MSNAQLEALAAQDDIKLLREQINEDPSLKFIKEQLNSISTTLVSMHKTETPVLDLSLLSVQAANNWISKLQASRDTLTNLVLHLESYEEILEGLWIKATNIALIQPAIEGLRSNEQRFAYINQLFTPLLETRRSLHVTRKKLDIVSDNIQASFNALTQQQRNMQLVAAVTKTYGLNVADPR